MNKHVEMAAGSFARFVEQPRAGFTEAGCGGAEIWHAERYVVESGTVAFQEFGDGRIGCGWLKELDARIAGGQERYVDFFGGDGFVVRDFEA